MSVTKAPKQQLEDRHGSDHDDIILYHCDVPVMKVQKGTTFGLTKMLYESIGKDGRIIGLKPRKDPTSLVCIITQDLTILTEQEYDLIIFVRKADDPQSHKDESVNSVMDFKAQDDYDGRSALIKPTFNTSGSQTLSNEGSIPEWLSKKYHFNAMKESHSTTNQDTDFAISHIHPRKDTYAIKLRYDREWVSVKDAAHDNRSDDHYVVYHGLNSQGSASSSPIVSDADSGSPRSSKCSPSQPYQPLYHQKPSNEDTGGVQLEGESQSSEHLIPDGLGRKVNKKWECLYCLKSFVCRSALENHQRTHTGEKPFQCTHCGRCFSHLGNLKQHLHIHREVKPHVCNICGKGFTRSNRLRDHRLSHGVVTADNNCKIRMRTKVEWSPGRLRNLPSLHEGASEPVEPAHIDPDDKDFQRMVPSRE